MVALIADVAILQAGTIGPVRSVNGSGAFEAWREPSLVPPGYPFYETDPAAAQVLIASGAAYPTTYVSAGADFVFGNACAAKGSGRVFFGVGSDALPNYRLDALIGVTYATAVIGDQVRCSITIKCNGDEAYSNQFENAHAGLQLRISRSAGSLRAQKSIDSGHSWDTLFEILNNDALWPYRVVLGNGVFDNQSVGIQ